MKKRGVASQQKAFPCRHSSAVHSVNVHCNSSSRILDMEGATLHYCLVCTEY